MGHMRLMGGLGASKLVALRHANSVSFDIKCCILRKVRLNQWVLYLTTHNTVCCAPQIYLFLEPSNTPLSPLNKFLKPKSL